MDYKPRKFDAECCNILANFAEMVVRDTERYAAAEQRAGLQQQNPLTQACAPLMSVLCNCFDRCTPQ